MVRTNIPIFSLLLLFVLLGGSLTSCTPRTVQIPSTPTPVKPVNTLVRFSTQTPEPLIIVSPASTDTPAPMIMSVSLDTPCFQLLTPNNTASLEASGKVTFSWEPVLGAVNYKLEISLPSGQKAMFETSETSRELYMEALQMGGIFQWQVSAYDNNTSVLCTSQPFAFEKPENSKPTQSKGENRQDDNQYMEEIEDCGCDG